MAGAVDRDAGGVEVIEIGPNLKELIVNVVALVAAAFGMYWVGRNM